MVKVISLSDGGHEAEAVLAAEILQRCSTRGLKAGIVLMAESVEDVIPEVEAKLRGHGGERLDLVVILDPSLDDMVELIEEFQHEFMAFDMLTPKTAKGILRATGRE